MTPDQLPEDAVVIELPPIFLNQSRYKNFFDCPRYYGWLHVEGLVSSRPRKQLVTGRMVHDAQLEIHSGGNTPEVIAAATERAAKRFVEEMKPPEGPQILIGIAEEKLKEEAKEGEALIKKMLPAYHRHWGERGMLWKPLGQELEFTVEVGEETNVFLVGRIDNLAIFMNGLWIVDYKTMVKNDPREFLKWNTDIQLTAYIYGGSKQLTLDARKLGKPPVRIRGAIIDGMIKTLIPQFEREMFTRTIEDLREFEQEWCFSAWDIAAREAMIKGERKKHDLFREKQYALGASGGWKIAFPKATNHCYRYGQCSHLDLCVKDNETRRLAFIRRGSDYVDNARAAAAPREEEGL